MARVLLVGGGYVGLCTAAALAEHGHSITVVDTNAARLTAVSDGRAPFHEPGLDPIISKHVRAGTLLTANAIDAVGPHDFVFLCVGTPSDGSGAADLRHIVTAASEVGAAIARWGLPVVVAIKSTVPPGTARNVVKPALERASRLREGEDFFVASIPEFLREGSAVRDALSPDRIVVGADHVDGLTRVWSLLAAHTAPRVSVDLTTAEMVKYSANSLLAARIAVANELANIAAAHGVDWYRVVGGLTHDPRIGGLFLRAGAGFGGSCFPKDVAAIAQVGASVGVPARILEAVLASNDSQPIVAVNMLEEELGSLTGKRIALLGLAFKPDTDDVRATRALLIYEALRKRGAEVTVHDPVALSAFGRLVGTLDDHATSVLSALRDADGCIIQTEWEEYRKLDPTRFVELMRTPIVVDGRRTFDPERMRAAGIRYRAIGLGRA